MARILTHTTGQAGFAVNSYLIETPAAVVAVDAPFLLSDARSFRAQLDALAKPLAGVLVTHGHPDHVNGIATPRSTPSRTGWWSLSTTTRSPRPTGCVS